jgi:uncharacterized protein (DUF1697 family)
MTRYVAFLRGLNVGGHTVKMDALKKHFEAMGFDNVSTFIASGNVIFETDKGSSDALEEKIEAALRRELGYDVATFLRTDAQVADVASHKPFPKSKVKDGDNLHVTFLKNASTAAVKKRVLALATDDDLLHFHDRELYWLRRGRLMDATFDTKELNKALGKDTTMRNANTVQKLAEKYPPD